MIQLIRCNLSYVNARLEYQMILKPNEFYVDACKFNRLWLIGFVGYRSKRWKVISAANINDAEYEAAMFCINSIKIDQLSSLGSICIYTDSESVVRRYALSDSQAKEVCNIYKVPRDTNVAGLYIKNLASHLKHHQKR